MALPSELVDEFAKVTHDTQEKKEATLFYGTARFTNDGDFVKIDGSDLYTPATFATSAITGDRVMGTIKNHRAIVTANITNPSMTLGILRAISGIIVEGYLTTNAQRIRYDDQTKVGLTFSNGGIGAYGGQGKYWYITSTGDFRAESAYVKGTVSASSGYIGSETNGFKIDEYGIYSGANKTGTSSGFITLGNTDFQRSIGGTSRTLRFAIGSNFGVTATGVVYANDVNVRGNVTATAGKVGDFNINGAIYSSSKSTFASTVAGVYLGTDGIALGQDNKFKVTSAGVLTATGATISGVLTAGSGSTIGPWGVSTTSIYKGTNAYNNANSLYFGDSGLSIKQNFKVNSSGTLTATGATISGAITATSLTLGSGVTVPYTKISDPPDLTVYVTKGGAIQRIGSTPAEGATGFVVSSDGLLKASNATIFGTIYASAGKIGGWLLESEALNKETADGNYRIRLQAPNSPSATGNRAIRLDHKVSGSWTDVFYVRYDGYLYATSANISGTIKATGGTIGGFAIDDSSIHTNGTAITSNASSSLGLSSSTFTRTIGGTSRANLKFAIGSNFGVTNTGVLYASSVNVSTGQVGPLHLTTSAIYTNNATSYGSGDGVRISYGAVNSSNDYYISLQKGTESTVLFQGGLAIENSHYYIYTTTTSLETNANIVAKSFKIVGEVTSGGLSFESGKTLIHYNGTNLWIGATSSTATPHLGATYITTGDSSNSSIYVAVPNSSYTNSSLYAVLHTGNYKSYTAVKVTTLTKSDVSVKKESYANADFTVSTPSGYSLIGVVLCWFENDDGGSNYTKCSIGTITTINSGAGVRVRVRNDSSSDAYIVVKIKVLFARTV